MLPKVRTTFPNGSVLLVSQKEAISIDCVLPAKRSEMANRTFELRSRSLSSLLRGFGSTKAVGDISALMTALMTPAGPAAPLPRCGVPRNTMPLHVSSTPLVQSLSDAIFIAWEKA